MGKSPWSNTYWNFREIHYILEHPTRHIKHQVVFALKSRLPRFSHISTFMTEQLHWLPLTARIQFKILFLTCKAFLGQTPLCLCGLIRRPISATSGRPLRSLDHHDLLVPRSRTATAQHRAYASVVPLFWNEIPTITRALMLYGGVLLFLLVLLRLFFFRGAFRTGSASD